MRPGDRVGIAALSGQIVEGRLSAGIDSLRALGFDPVPARNLLRQDRFFAGRDDERIEAFHELAARSDLTAIFFARGGYGVMRILDRIDWDLLRSAPRAYVGYSDLTPFLLEVTREVGVATFHGPMIAGEFARGLEAEETHSLLSAIGDGEIGELPLTHTVGGGAVTAPLVGGCLSMLTATLGTPYAPQLDGSILFWEDVNEPLYRLDRMLTHLRLSGSLARIRGMVVGETRVADVDEVGERAFGDMLESLSAEFGWPVGWGLPSGHGCPNRTVPLGLRATFDPERRRLTFESEVSG